MNRKMFDVWGLVVFMVLALGSVAGGGIKKALDDLTGPWQLFVDDCLVTEKINVVRNYHSFEKYADNPVMSADKPWEGSNVYLYGTVMPAEDGSGYRMWYHGYNPQGNFGGRCGYFNAYATSKDGVNWEKPDLDIIEWRGSTENNMFLTRKRSPGDDHTPSVIHTPWEKDPQKRYKLITFVYALGSDHPYDEGYWGSYSPDGINWTDVADNPVLLDTGDVGQFAWDAHKKQYMGIMKIWTTVPRHDGFRRCIGLSTTKDFEHWPYPELVLVPDEIDDNWVTSDDQSMQLYGLSPFAYESGYIGLLWMYRIDGVYNSIFCEVVSSRDGVNWIRAEPINGKRPVILPNGPDGSWDDGMIFTARQPLVEGDTMKLWYGAFNAGHHLSGDAAIGLATLRKDGFASLDAGAKTGIVTTKLLDGLRGRLYVNAEIKGGEIKAEVLDADGKVVKGYSRDDCKAVSGNGIEQLITWKGHKRLPRARKPMRLRFVMSNASVYSFRAGDNVDVAEEPAVFNAFFDFEGDSSKTATDKASGDGIQQAKFHNNVTVINDPVNACGDFALAFTSDGKTLSTFQIVDTMNPGKNFTLAAKVKTGEKRLTRLFSAYRGCDKPVTGELIFDFNPADGVVRFIVNGQTVESSQQTIEADNYHHYAVTYNQGEVKLYLDGKEIGSGRLRSGSCFYIYDNIKIVKEHFNEPHEKTVAGIYLSSDLRFGEDSTGKFAIPEPVSGGFKRGDLTITGLEEQLIGFVDDILLTRRTLSAQEIAALSKCKH